MTLQAARASVDETSRRANLAMAAIGAVGALEALGCAFNDLDAPGVSCQLLCYAAWVGAAILYCGWLYRAYGDVVLLGGSSLRFKPAEAVASFFLPIVGLYRPYQALVELHEASDPDAEQSVRDGMLPLRAWWALWLCAPWFTGILDNASVITQLMNLDKLTDPSALLVSRESPGDGLMRLLAALIHVALSALAVAVVRGIVARQRERLRRLEATAASAPENATPSPT